MTPCLLHTQLLRTASLLVPAVARSEWLEEWRSELWYIPAPDATAFCLGAFRDALWVRQNTVPTRLESPLSCLAFLFGVAVASTLIAYFTPAPWGVAPVWRLTARDFPAGCSAMLFYTVLLLPAARITMGGGLLRHPPLSWHDRIRAAAFFTAKVALVQPIMFSALLIGIRLAPVIVMGACALWMLTFRWVLLDQRERCPFCLHRLTNPVRIGSASHSFLEWYGGESICSRGHGFLQEPELSTSYSGARQWLRLGGI